MKSCLFCHHLPAVGHRMVAEGLVDGLVDGLVGQGFTVRVFMFFWPVVGFRIHALYLADLVNLT